MLIDPYGSRYTYRIPNTQRDIRQPHEIHKVQNSSGHFLGYVLRTRHIHIVTYIRVTIHMLNMGQSVRRVCTEQQQLDVLGRLQSIFLEVPLDETAARCGGSLLRRLGAPHDAHGVLAKRRYLGACARAPCACAPFEALPSCRYAPHAQRLRDRYRRI